jgi:hypothetical protein
VIIYGWQTQPIVLATKQDLCPTCHVAGPHAIVRYSRWVHVFWIPVMPIWIGHKLACGNCGAVTKLKFGQVRSALKTGRLPLPPRPGFSDYATKVFDETYRKPNEAEFDPIERNPKRGGWDLALKLWPVAILALALAVAFWPKPPPAPPAQNTAHDCWVAADGGLSGCRIHDGSVDGYAIGSPTTCYFLEPLPTGSYKLHCDD